MSAASDITRKAKSNLAFALKILPPERRDDMVTFYAFCRTMDDIADEAEVSPTDRVARLNAWRKLLEASCPEASGDDPGLVTNEFQREVLEMRNRNQIPNDLLIAIIDGCEMDLRPQRFGTWDDLAGYTWKVASAVGLVSVRLFGCKDPRSKDYAVALGHALQLTNILRDVAEDLTNGVRIYLPLADLAQFQYTERDLVGRVHDGRFMALMAYEADRAENFFRCAEELTPKMDYEALVPARIMAETYQLLLAKMRDDGFQVFNKRYKISKARKLMILSKHLIARKHPVT